MLVSINDESVHHFHFTGVLRVAPRLRSSLKRNSNFSQLAVHDLLLSMDMRVRVFTR